MKSRSRSKTGYRELAELRVKDVGKAGIERGPYQDLYIYLLKGLVGQNDEPNLGAAFLGNWVEDDSSFLFFGSPADKEVGRLLKTRPELELIEAHYFTYEQWQGQELKAFRVAGPPWEIKSAGKDGLQIVLDPGVVFGNGLHPTTRDCLKALAFARKQSPFTRVLDLGTGTGVLALAAALLGAEGVLAVDINPLCVRTAIYNVELNGLGETIQVVHGSAEGFIHEPADLVVANIHHEVIERLLNSGGFSGTKRFIISGLMRSQFRDVIAWLETNQFLILREWDHEMTWFTLLAKKEIGK
ncbi:MAG: 50S ribosomal protein L11 methyltransferase [Deltaproteobacteria bacterium]|nr:50S ribosomal protein L11 methyltransferase [Deltaproteobacteria bacterium]